MPTPYIITQWVRIARRLRIPMLLAVAMYIFFFVVLDWTERPVCQKAMCLELLGWQSANNTETELPNVDGNGRKSMMQLGSLAEGYATEWVEDYRYVPGLNVKDPGDLVLIYRCRPTRWRVHITTEVPLRTAKKKWIIIPPNFFLMDEDDPTLGEPGGEFSFSVTEEEFRQRLTRTLEYLASQDRPHWRAVVAEHQAFLNSVGHEFRNDGEAGITGQQIDDNGNQNSQNENE